MLLEGKVAIITGANSGIGKELALDFACRKARVIIACRSQEKAEKAVVEIKRKSNNNDVIFRQLDLSSLDSVRHFSSIIHEEEAKVDILVNNAGLMGCPYTRTQDGFEMHFGTNHLGHFLLTNLLLDCLEKAPAARIVTITSSLYKRCPGIKFDDLDHERAYDPMQAYAHSKLANILFIRALDRRLRGSKVTVNATHTAGMVRTELGRYTLEKASLWVKVGVFAGYSTMYDACTIYLGTIHPSSLCSALLLEGERSAFLWLANSQVLSGTRGISI